MPEAQPTRSFPVRRRVHLLISGRVQGVGYRAAVRRWAEAGGLSGWVRNLADGRVEVMAEGDGMAVEALIQRCRQGPPLARVADCRLTEAEPEGDLAEFRILRAETSL